MTTYHIFKCITIISGAYRVVSSQVVSIGNICMCYWQKKNYLVSFPDAYMCLIAKQFFLSVEVRVAVRDNENTWDYRLEANDLVGSVPMWSESGSELCLDHPFSLLGALLKYQIADVAICLKPFHTDHSRMNSLPWLDTPTFYKYSVDRMRSVFPGTVTIARPRIDSW